MNAAELLNESKNYNIEALNILNKELELTEFKISNVDDDIKKATDFISIDNYIRVGFRTRNKKYESYFDKDFTIRYDVSSGYKTEYEKIVKDKYMTYYLYCLVDKNNFKILKWKLLDMDVFRDYHDYSKMKISNNTDGLSELATFKYKDFPSSLIFSQSS